METIFLKRENKKGTGRENRAPITQFRKESVVGHWIPSDVIKYTLEKYLISGKN